MLSRRKKSKKDEHESDDVISAQRDAINDKGDLKGEGKDLKVKKGVQKVRVPLI